MSVKLVNVNNYTIKLHHSRAQFQKVQKHNSLCWRDFYTRFATTARKSGMKKEEKPTNEKEEKPTKNRKTSKNGGGKQVKKNAPMG